MIEMHMMQVTVPMCREAGKERKHHSVAEVEADLDTHKEMSVAIFVVNMDISRECALLDRLSNMVMAEADNMVTMQAMMVDKPMDRDIIIISFP